MSKELIKIGKKIYNEALSDRRGFAYRQLEIDSDVWDEIYTSLGEAAIKFTKSYNK